MPNIEDVSIGPSEVRPQVLPHVNHGLMDGDADTEPEPKGSRLSRSLARGAKTASPIAEDMDHVLLQSQPLPSIECQSKWLSYLRRDRSSAATKKSYRNNIKRFMEWVRHRRATDVSKALLHDFIHDYAGVGEEHGTARSANTVK